MTIYPDVGGPVQRAVDDIDGRLGSLESVTAEQSSALVTLSARELDDNNYQDEQLSVLAQRVENLTLESRNHPFPGYLSIAMFPGIDDTERLRAGLAYCATCTPGMIPALVLPPGTVLAPGTTPFQLFSGAGIIGGLQMETEFSYRNRVTIQGAAPNGVFDFPNDTRGISIANIGWEGPGRSVVCRFMPDNGSRLCYSQFHGLSFDNFTSVLRKPLLGFVWSGGGYCNNSSETPIQTSGSDYHLWLDSQYFIDSPNLKDTDYLLHVKSGNKCTIGSVFITGEGATPLRVSGGQMVRIINLEMEAAAIDRKVNGAGLLVSGGNVIVDNAWFFRCMWNPASPDLAAVGRADKGVVNVYGVGTSVRLDNATFGEYNTIPEKPGGHTENHVYCGAQSTVVIGTALPWNMQANSGTGGTTGSRPLQTQKAAAGVILTNTLTKL